jgi:hypothetical protein
LGAIYLAVVWITIRQFAGHNNFWIRIVATVGPLVPYPVVYVWKCLTARAAFKSTEQPPEVNLIQMTITDVLFDPNGLTEFYIAFRLSNVGIPSTISNVSVSVRRHGQPILDKLAPRLTFAPLIRDVRGQLVDGKNPFLAPLETGAERDLMFTFTYEGNAKQELGGSGTCFRFVGFDISGREVMAEYIIP